MLNVHPSLLPRWRGAAPIERAIMAGEERTGVCIMGLTAGLDSGPVALREEVAIGSEEDFEALSGKLAALGGELLVGAFDQLAQARLDFAEQDDDAATYAEKIAPEERRLDPGRPAIELARVVRALTPHVGAYLETSGGERLGVRRARAVDVGVKAGEVRAEWGALLLGCGQGALRLEVVQPRRQADGGRRLPARPPAAQARAVIAPARVLAFETIQATFEQEAHTELAFRQAADERGLDGRERAQAQRLAFGAVQRRGTIDAALSRLVDRPLRDLDPPLRAALRLGMYELLFADGTPDHAAVDQAVELTKRAGAAHASGLVNAVLRRAIRERDALVGSLLGDDSTPEAAAAAHSAPLWLAQMWWQELGAEGARRLLAACNEPAELAVRVNTLTSDRERVLGKLREAGVEAAPAAGRSPLASPEQIVIAGRTGAAVPELIAAGELTPQSRGSAAVVELLDPQPGEHVLDLCAGPGIKTGQIAARMGDRGEVISVESDSERAAEVAEQARRLGLRSVTVIEANAGDAGMAPGFDRVLLDPPCSDLGALASRPDARWRKSPATIERLAEEQGRLLRRGLEALRPGGTLVYSTCTVSRRENEERIAALLEAAAAGEAPRVAVDDLGAVAPDLASAADSRCLQIRPDRDLTTGFFICRLRRDDAGDE